VIRLEVCIVCDVLFEKKFVMQRYCCKDCRDKFDRLPEIREVMKLSAEERVLRLKLIKIKEEQRR